MRQQISVDLLLTITFPSCLEVLALFLSCLARRDPCVIEWVTAWMPCGVRGREVVIGRREVDRLASRMLLRLASPAVCGFSSRHLVLRGQAVTQSQS